MNEKQALEIMEKLRLTATLSGADHDLARQAVQTLAQMVDSYQQVQPKHYDQQDRASDQVAATSDNSPRKVSGKL